MKNRFLFFSLSILLVFSVLFSCQKDEKKVEWSLFNPNESNALSPSDNSFFNNEGESTTYDYTAFEEAIKESKEEESSHQEISDYTPLSLEADLQSLSLNQFRMKQEGASEKESPEKSPNEVTENSSQSDSTKASVSFAPLTIDDFGPQGILESERFDNADIYITFSSPMVPLAQLEAPMTSFDFVEMTPPIEGTFRWLGSKTLNFEPKEPLQPEMEYQVLIKQGMKSLNGELLNRPHSFSFKTEAVQLISIEPLLPARTPTKYKEDLPPISPLSFKMTFSYPIDLAKVQSEIDFPNNRGIQWELVSALDIEKTKKEVSPQQEERLKRQFILTIKEALPESFQFIIKLKNSNKEFKFWTFKPFNIEENRCYFDESVLTLGFTHPVDLTHIDQWIQFSNGAKPKKEDFVQSWRGIDIKNFKVPYNSELTISLSKELSDTYGRVLGEDKTITLKIENARAFARFNTYGYRFLEAGFPAQTYWSHRNLSSISKAIKAVENPIFYKIPAFESTEFQAKENQVQPTVEEFGNLLNEKGHGAVYVGIEAQYPYYDSYYKRTEMQKDRNDQLIQVTDLGASVRWGYNGAIVWVQSLSTGAPVAGAKVEVLSSIDGKATLLQTGTTDASGFANLIFTDTNKRERSWMGKEYNKETFLMEGFVVRVSTADDQMVFVPNEGHNIWSSGIYNHDSYASSRRERLENLCFTDRGLYKPGEKLYFRGMALQRSVSDYEPFVGEYEVKIISQDDYQASPLLKAKGKTTDNGGYFGSYEIPKTLPVGNYAIVVQMDGLEYPTYTSFQVSEFKRAKFQLKMAREEKPVIVGDTISWNAKADLLAGGNLSNADYKVFWLTKEGHFYPETPKYQNYRFGVDDYLPSKSFGKKTGRLNEKGEVKLSQKTTASEVAGKTQSYLCEWSVTEPGQQQITTKKELLVHPADFYLGAKIESKSDSGWWSSYIPKDKAVTFETIALTPEEKLFENAGEVQYEILRHEWQEVKQESVYGYIDYRWEEKSVSVEKGKFNIGKKASATYRWTPKKAGSYEMKLSAKDAKGREVATRFNFYVTGGDWGHWIGDNPNTIVLTPEKKRYQAGEKARIFMKSPLEKGKYLVTLEREGILEQSVIEIAEQTQMLEVDVKEEYYPVFYFSICTATPRKAAPPAEISKPDFGKPQGYFGIAEIQVQSNIKKLDIDVQFTKDQYKPGERAMAKIQVSHKGTPVPNAECLFALVDRGVLDWKNYHLPNPMDFFYSADKFPHAVEGGDSRSLLMQPVMYRKADLAGGDMGKGMMQDSMAEKMYANGMRSVRDDFNPVAHIEPFLITDENGCALVDFHFPDSLTTYRTTVLASAKDLMGYKEDEIVVTQGVTAQLARPMALRMGDEVEMAVVLHNQSPEAHQLKLIASSDRLLFTDQHEAEFLLQAGEFKTVYFTVAPLKEGEATIEVALLSKNFNDVFQEKIDVLSPAVMEAFTVVGNSKESSEKPEFVVLPEKSLPTKGGLELNFIHSPFPMLPRTIEQMSEQRVYPLSIEELIYQAAPHFLFSSDLKKLSPKLKYDKKKILDLIAQLKQTHQGDGGFAYYPSFSGSSKTLSAFVAEANYWAETRGVALLEKEEKEALQNFLIGIDTEEDYPVENRSYLYYVRSLMGENVQSLMENWAQEEKNASLEERFYNALTYLHCGNEEAAKAVYQEMKNRLKIGTQTVELKESTDRMWWGSDSLKNLSLLLQLHYEFNGLDDEAFRIANSIANVQKHYLWYSRKGLFQYWVVAAQIFENDRSWFKNVTATVDLGDERLLSETFEKGKEENYSFFFPMNAKPLNQFAKGEPLKLEFDKKNLGERGYFYAATLSYGLPSEGIEARNEGIDLQTSVEDLEGNEIKDQKLKLGESYRMKLSLKLKKEAYQMVIEVPLPSGCDAIQNGMWSEPTYGGMNWNSMVRGWGKNAVYYRFDTVRAGEYYFEFLFRATNGGKYPTPPAQASLLDEPEVFGRTAGLLWEIH